MYLRFHLIIWSLILWGSTWTMWKEEWDSLLPDMTSLCPNVDYCGKTEPTTGNVETDSNVCCLGCSCESTCREKGDCCDDTGDVKTLTECLKPSTDQDISLNMYKFVAKPPPDGCENVYIKAQDGSIQAQDDSNVTCSSDEKAKPWVNSFPVYSRSLDRNFKNAACARCHGAPDIEDWKRDLFMESVSDFGRSLATFYEKKELTDLMYMVFSPPNPRSSTIDKLCFKVTDLCRYNETSYFFIPSTVKLDKRSVIRACEDGPAATYNLRHGLAFKNVFCAICNGYTIKSLDRVRCEFNLDDSRNLNPPIRVLLDSSYVSSIKSNSLLEKNGKRDCYRPKGSKNSSICERLYCPASQVRLQNGKCGFAAKFVKIENLVLCLNVSSDQGPFHLNVTEMSEGQVHSLLRERMPWSENWSINLIGSIIHEESSNLEFLVCLVQKMKYLNLESLKNDIVASLAKKWKIGSGPDEDMDQTFSKHGQLVPEDRIFLKPRWSRFLMPLTSNLTSPIWKTMYAKRIRAPFTYNEMFICEQIELQPDEYKLENEGSVMYLQSQHTYIYPNQYFVLENGDRPKRVRVCLENSGYVKVASGGPRTTNGKTLQVIFILWCLIGLKKFGEKS